MVQGCFLERDKIEWFGWKKWGLDREIGRLKEIQSKRRLHKGAWMTRKLIIFLRDLRLKNWLLVMLQEKPIFYITCADKNDL